MSHYRKPFLLFWIWLCLLLPFQGFASALHLQHIDELTKRLERSQTPVVHQEDLLGRLHDHHEVTLYTRSLGTFLVQELQAERSLSGTHLNLINVAVGTFLTLTTQLLKEADQLAQEGLNLNRAPQRTVAWMVTMAHLTERFKTIHSLYFSEQGLRKILQDKARFELYGLQDLHPLTQRLLSETNKAELLPYLYSFHQRPVQVTQALYTQLEISTLYQLTGAREPIDDIFRVSSYWTDRLGAVTEGITRLLSNAFGSAVGDIEWRTGHLHQMPGLEEEIRQKLRPLDIIYEKRTFKFTDYTIPGHWGHLAVWLGSKEELMELGVWDHPALDFFREAIERGEQVYEVRRWGLQFDTLENFLNLDEFAITRVSSLLDQSVDEIAEIYEHLALQWTKGYDFTFNALATDRVTCTEIIFLSYGPINWPRGLILGRTTITPDHMAELTFYSNSPMELVTYLTAEQRHRPQKKSVADFARTVGFVQRPGVPYFEQHHRACRNQRVRHHGALRMHMVCRDEFEHKSYTPPTLFDLDFGQFNPL